LLTTIYPEIKDVFTSSFDLDEKLEREKALLLEKMAPVLAHEIRNPLGSIKGAHRSSVGGGKRRTEKSSRRDHRRGEPPEPGRDAVSRLCTAILARSPAAVDQRSHREDHGSRRSQQYFFGIDIHWNCIRTFPWSHRPGADPSGILNIAINALEAMPEGGTLTVRTTLIESDTGDAVGISIRDTGKGIPREQLKHIFTPFFTRRSEGRPGTGRLPAYHPGHGDRSG